MLRLKLYFFSSVLEIQECISVMVMCRARMFFVFTVSLEIHE